jgi:peptidoglycan hydrolase CwlO-like protein
MRKIIYTFVIISLFLTYSALAQSVFPGKQTLNKQEYFGLNLNSSIPERYLEDYWKEYLKSFGRVRSRRGIYTLDHANVPAIASTPVAMTSQVSTANNVSHLFLAVKVNNNYVANFTDSVYRATENFLKDFSAFAVLRDELRMAEEFYADADKNHQRLQRESDRIANEIERTQKRLEELTKEQEIAKKDLAGSVIDLQNKQKDLEVSKARIPKM